jgi:hypothetical protein
LFLSGDLDLLLFDLLLDFTDPLLLFDTLFLTIRLIYRYFDFDFDRDLLELTQWDRFLGCYRLGGEMLRDPQLEFMALGFVCCF